MDVRDRGSIALGTKQGYDMDLDSVALNDSGVWRLQHEHGCLRCGEHARCVQRAVVEIYGTSGSAISHKETE